MARLRVLLAAPATDFAPTAGTFRHALALAGGMVAAGAQVMVAVRRTGCVRAAGGIGLLAVHQPSGVRAEPDGVAVRGLDPIEHVRYLRALRRVGAEARPRFDAVLELGSRVTGVLGLAFQTESQPFVVSECGRPPRPRVRGLRSLVRLVGHAALEQLSRRGFQGARRVICETEILRRLLTKRGYARPEALRVIENGVDTARFRPQDRNAAREGLGLAPEVCTILYVGGLDMYHDLGPLIDAFGAIRRRGERALALHVVGDGTTRVGLEARAGSVGAAVTFHGALSHAEVPRWIAAADLCVGPYRQDLFPGGEVTFSTLKIREYLAAGRPVATVPSGGPAALIRDRQNGFLVANTAPAWQALLRDLPDRQALDALGQTAAATPIPTWTETGAAYLAILQEARAAR